MSHLALALGELRLRLQRLAQEHAARPAVRPAEKPLDVMLAEVREKMDALEEAMDPPPALTLLAGCLGLTRFERDVLLLCAGMELDTRIAGLCAAAQTEAE